MSTVVEQNARQTAQTLSSIVTSVAANDDVLPSDPIAARDASTTGGWNAHDVWRRLIKEARDRRTAREAQ
jgi:hypothetical protein